MERKDGWIETFSGRQFWSMDPRAEEVMIEDIAHSLCNLCRFAGHSRVFYSVGRHSENCRRVAERLRGSSPDALRLQMLCLIHDAAEAYIGDLPRPIKQFIPEFKVVERKVEAVIYEALQIVPPTEEEERFVKHIDNYMLCIEGRLLTRNLNDWTSEIVEGCPFTLDEEDFREEYFTREYTDQEFIATYHKLKGQLAAAQVK